MKILVNGEEANILVKVPKDRKCAASIDIIIDTTEAPLARLSFGDLDTPEVDVEVDFTFEQLLELMQVVALGYNMLDTATQEYKRKLLEVEETKEKERKAKTQRYNPPQHTGSC